MPKQSAGILLYRQPGPETEVFLVHPGGPFYARKDNGVWTIPKGEYDTGTAEDAALREFYEETGVQITLAIHFLASVKMKSGKTVHCFTCAADLDETAITSNHFEIEWPPRSGKMQSFPEVDKGAWLTLAAAREKILPVQTSFLDALEHYITTVQE